MDRGDEVRSFVMPRRWKKKHCLLLSFVILFASPILCTIMAKKEHRVRAQRDHNQWTNFLVAKQYAFPFWLHST